MAAENTKVVQAAYAAFGRGDVQGILDTLDDSIVWKPITGAAAHVPHAGERRGKTAVAEFFKILSETTDFTSFEPREFIAERDRVVVLGAYTAKVKKTGRSAGSEWAMVFTVRNGKITAFQEFTDSAALNAAYA